MATEPLNLLALRKQQRRVAALLDRVRTELPHHSIKRDAIPLAATFPLGGQQHWCSRLDSEGAHQNPALNFLRQGLRYAKKERGLYLDFGEVQYRRPYRLKKMTSKPQDISQEVTTRSNHDNGYDSDKMSFQYDINNLRTPHAVTNSSSSGYGKSTTSDYKNINSETVQSLFSMSPGKSSSVSLLPVLAEPVSTAMSTPLSLPPLQSSPSMSSSFSRQNTKPIHVRIPTESTADNGESPLLNSPTKLKFRTRTFYSSVPDITEQPENINFDSYRANLEYQHGVPPLPDDQIRSLLKSRHDASRRNSRGASGLVVDRLDTGNSSRWCTCGYRPSLSSAEPCKECKRVTFHDPTCSKYSKDDIPLCPRCGKHVRVQNPPSAMPAVVNKTLERAMAKINDGYVDNSEKQNYVNNLVQKKKGRVNRSKIGNELTIDYADNGDSDKMVVVDGRLQTPESYLINVERRILSGKYDCDVDIDVTDVGKVPTPDMMKSPDDVTSKTKEVSFDDDGDDDEGIDWNSDVYRTAYIRALADARAKQLPPHPDFLSMRTTRAFVFSYFEHVPFDCKCPKCLIPSSVSTNQKSEMKMIFGDINPDDYLPGGRKGRKVKRKRQKTKSQEIVLPKIEKSDKGLKPTLQMSKR